MAIRYSANKKYYKVSIHKSGKYRYASTQPTVVDKETGKKKSLHIHWGTLDDHLRFYPNKKYLSASEEERNHLVFPDNWDLTLVDNLSLYDETEHQVKDEKRLNSLLDNYPYVRSHSVEADQIYRLIRTLRQSELSSDDILDAVLSMEKRDETGVF